MKNTYISFAASYALISWSKNLRCLAFKPHETDCFKEAKTHHKGFYCLCKLVELKGANKGAYSRPWHAASYALILQVLNPYHFAWLSRFHELNVFFYCLIYVSCFSPKCRQSIKLKGKMHPWSFVWKYCGRKRFFSVSILLFYAYIIIHIVTNISNWFS